MRGNVVAAVAAAACLLAPATESLAASVPPGWSVVKTPSPPMPRGALSAVACPSANLCVAVGSSWWTRNRSAFGIAEWWDGTSWTLQRTANPAGQSGATLSGVSCPGPTACTAVGYYTDGGGRLVTLAERWNGNVWSVQPTPNPIGAASSLLSGVACTASECTAVGSSRSRQNIPSVLAERWDGASWTIQATPGPSGVLQSSLSGVACTAAAACLAVGEYVTVAATWMTLAERWNGLNWVVQSTPNPGDSSGSVLNGVACLASGACTAVGSYNRSGTGVTLAERWDGTAWSIQSTPNPSGVGQGSGSFLAGVSCTDANACTAVGDYPAGPTNATLAERWNGTAWTIQTTPNPPGVNSRGIGGVACAGNFCMAVGSRNLGNTDVTLAARWDGSDWGLVLTPNPDVAPQGSLSGVACPDSATCTVVGSYMNSAGNYVGLAERRSGTTWTVQPTALPGGGWSDYALTGVACSSAAACTAVGFAFGVSNEVTLAEQWNGNAWSVQPTPNPTDGIEFGLSGVACTSSTMCIAVGGYTRPGGSQALAEQWNGSTWTILPNPAPVGARWSSLSGVACNTPTTCTAVGSLTPSGGPEMALAVQWNGTDWAIQPTPSPSAADGSSLTGIACAGPAACTAVGYFYGPVNGGVGQLTLAERWDGSNWTVQPTPNPAGFMGSTLSGVSCPDALACTAVGSYTTRKGVLLTLAEGWSGGTWVIEPTPNPNGTVRSALAGVGCMTTTACIAAGDWLARGGGSLVEQFSG